jgi:hypothetical protein
MIWGTPVTGTQFFGYAIALSGLVYYKLGGDQLKQQIAGVSRMWSELGMQRPRLRQAIIFVAIFVLMLILLGGVGPRFAGKSGGWLTSVLSGSPV